MRRQLTYDKYQQMQVQTADKGNLLLMLYDALVVALKKAQLQLDNGTADRQEFSHQIFKSREIILELVGALNPDANQEMTESLQSLYDYFLWQISQAVTEKKSEPINDVIQHVTGLRQAWGQAVQENRAQQPNTQTGQPSNLRSQMGTIKA